ncbi:MerR family transcriptional regulator [Noviherbaspirillum galbum]|uniref:MerR family transcriptional regulator n=1 Tax=Noviherbaspirillum galbum TaxID=2709383 RepID=A0A6B3SK96_9BURK|nr:MerR family transcriptional regulator [Noviherbaspirillum galbum]NEX60978.1 MerR family transcriptional regulator [Noviherbaspirillum galbum]
MKTFSGQENTETTGGDNGVGYRSGVAARLAGLSPETLRVWERRYDLSDTRRSPNGRRLYTAEQVRRLGLIKLLVDQGHAIGVLARLTIEQLQELAGPRTGGAQAGGPLRVAVIGDSLARRIRAAGQEGTELAVQCSCPRLDRAASLPKDADVEVLLIELSELDESALPLIHSAREACAAAAVVVLYRFCASATIRALRAQNCVVARIPAELGELAVLCRSALAGERLPPPERPHVPDVRFDEEVLSAMTSTGNRMVCECPRHLAELLLMVGSFERYSAQCASRNDDDARLHQDLQLAAGRARAILETAMEQLARAEGLPLPGAS